MDLKREKKQLDLENATEKAKKGVKETIGTITGLSGMYIANGGSDMFKPSEETLKFIVMDVMKQISGIPDVVGTLLDSNVDVCRDVACIRHEFEEYRKVQDCKINEINKKLDVIINKLSKGELVVVEKENKRKEDDRK